MLRDKWLNRAVNEINKGLNDKCLNRTVNELNKMLKVNLNE
jgi:hypothetical protein